MGEFVESTVSISIAISLRLKANFGLLVGEGQSAKNFTCRYTTGIPARDALKGVYRLIAQFLGNRT